MVEFYEPVHRGLNYGEQIAPSVNWAEVYSTPDGIRMRLEDHIDMASVRRQIAALEDELVLPLLIEWLRNHGYTVTPPEEA
jgi:hypothetical protein